MKSRKDFVSKLACCSVFRFVIQYGEAVLEMFSLVTRGLEGCDDISTIGHVNYRAEETGCQLGFVWAVKK